MAGGGERQREYKMKLANRFERNKNCAKNSVSLDVHTIELRLPVFVKIAMYLNRRMPIEYGKLMYCTNEVRK